MKIALEISDYYGGKEYYISIHPEYAYIYLSNSHLLMDSIFNKTFVSGPEIGIFKYIISKVSMEMEYFSEHHYSEVNRRRYSTHIDKISTYKNPLIYKQL